MRPDVIAGAVELAYARAIGIANGSLCMRETKT
jgi:hypothetical protein